jgi:hypothetical protein
MLIGSSIVKPPAWPVIPSLTAFPDLWRGCKIFIPLQGNIQNIANGVAISSASGSFTIGDMGQELVDTAITMDSVASSDVLSGIILWDDKSNSTNEFYRHRDVSASLSLFEIGTNNSSVIEIDGNATSTTYVSRSVLGFSVNNGEQCDIYLDGEFQESVNINGWSDATVDDDFNPFANSVNQILLIIWKGRYLSSAEHKILGWDPFAMLRPGPQLHSPAIFADLGAAGTTYNQSVAGSMGSLSGSLGETITFTEILSGAI